MKKIALLLVLLMLAAFPLAGCNVAAPAVSTAASSESASNDEPESPNSSDASISDEKPINIIFCTPLTGHPVWLDCKKGFEDALAEEGATGQWVGPQGIDQERMILDIENAIAQKADAIITCDLNREAFAPVLKKVNDAGIPFALINTDDPDSGRLISVGTEPINVVKKLMPDVIKAIGDKEPHVILMQSDMTVQTQIDQIAEIKNILSKVPGYQLNSHEVDEADMLKDTEKISNLFMTYPDTNVLITVAANGAPAASKAIKDLNLQDKGIIVTGMDDLDETIAGIKDGTILGTCTQNFYKMGYLATKALIKKLRTGEDPESAVVDSGTIFVTLANVETYKEEMKK